VGELVEAVAWVATGYKKHAANYRTGVASWTSCSAIVKVVEEVAMARDHRAAHPMLWNPQRYRRTEAL
jgi:hypothetical protein